MSRITFSASCSVVKLITGFLIFPSFLRAYPAWCGPPLSIDTVGDGEVCRLLDTRPIISRLLSWLLEFFVQLLPHLRLLLRLHLFHILEQLLHQLPRCQIFLLLVRDALHKTIRLLCHHFTLRVLRVAFLLFLMYWSTPRLMTSAIRMPLFSQYLLSLAICAFGNVTTIRGLCVMVLVYSDITRCQD